MPGGGDGFGLAFAEPRGVPLDTKLFLSFDYLIRWLHAQAFDGKGQAVPLQPGLRIPHARPRNFVTGPAGARRVNDILEERIREMPLHGLVFRINVVSIPLHNFIIGKSIIAISCFRVIFIRVVKNLRACYRIIQAMINHELIGQ